MTQTHTARCGHPRHPQAALPWREGTGELLTDSTVPSYTLSFRPQHNSHLFQEASQARHEAQGLDSPYGGPTPARGHSGLFCLSAIALVARTQAFRITVSPACASASPALPTQGCLEPGVPPFGAMRLLWRQSLGCFSPRHVQCMLN